MTTLLIYGSAGQLGWELTRVFKAHGISALGLDLPHHDVCDARRISEIIDRETPSAVINASAFTAVDQAETQQEAAFNVNREGPSRLAQACASAGIPLVHVSTDYVFDGTSRRPYVEEDPIRPIGVYGLSKAQGENEVRTYLDRHLIVRTSWVYGVHGQNFVKTMLRLGKENPTIRVVDDQYGCPTWARDLARALAVMVLRILEQRDVPWGTYHYCGDGVTSWYGFARAVFERAETYIPLKLRELTAITTADYPTRAKRPVYSALDCEKINRAFGIRPTPWQQSLDLMLDELLRGNG
ncbi:dTDP-4-dehydrorhamnose reductase [Desulfatiferula olefinivorans]